MSASAYERWWQLHLRVARGETLSAQEQTTYEAGLDRFDREETSFEPEGLAELRILRAQIDQLIAAHAQLSGRSAQLDRHIATLEKVYQQLTGYELAMDTHESS
jgi:hypothetical protein